MRAKESSALQGGRGSRPVARLSSGAVKQMMRDLPRRLARLGRNERGSGGGQPTPSCRGRIARRFGVDTRGATAVEFALVASMLILTIVFVMTVALIEFLGQSLDYATQKAARQVMTGAAQSAGMSQSTFPTNALCPYLPTVMNCTNVIVNLYTVVEAAGPAGYYTYTTNNNGSGFVIPPLSNASAQFSPGVQGSYEYLVVVYPVTFFPAAFASILGTATYNGSSAYPLVATAAFRNEQY